MPRLHYVKKARKTIRGTGIKKGEPYYWWKFNRCPKQVSKTHPKPWQLTRSEFLQAVYRLQDAIGNATAEGMDELAELVDEWKCEIGDIRDDCQDKHDNMPQSLQEGDTGQLLQDRADAMQDWIDELEGVDLYSEDALEELQAIEPDLP